MPAWIQNILNWGGLIVIGLVGTGLVIVAIMDLWRGLHPAQKDFKQTGLGVGVGIVGGLLLVLGFTSFLNLMKTNANSIPKN